ncbi:MAG: ATP-binding protein [Bacteroidetes bacterium]|nr:ATP-binding protein [Bacteroidota bacterium]
MAKKKSKYTRAGAFDRGATPYFHGRTAILKEFDNILFNVRASRKGTIHLIVGDSGAGKSALLDQCKKRAKLRGWKVVQITPATLWDPRKMMNALGYKNRPMPDTIALSVPDLLKLGASSSKPKKRLIPNILSKRKRKPLLLLMDEAQKLSSAIEYPVEQRDEVKEFLDVIHNAHLRKPIVLLAAGLRTSLAALQVLDISRFGEKNIVRLGQLSENPERAVIRDWIMVEAGVKEFPAEWIDAIVKETLGWPRHVHSYARNTSDYLIENGGVMTPEGLNEVMDVGRKGRIQYYTQRVEQMDGDDVLCLA